MRVLKKSWGVLLAILSGVLLALCFPGYTVDGFVWVWAAPLMVALWCSDPSKVKPKNKKRGFFLGWLAGFVFWMMTVNWLLAMGDLDNVPAAGAWFAWIGLSCYLAIYIAIWGMFLASVGNPWRKISKLEEGETEQNKSRLDQRIEKKLADQQMSKKKRFDLAGSFGDSMRVMRFAVMHASLWVVLEWVRGWLFTGFTWNGLGVAFYDTPTMTQAADLIGVTGLSFLPILVCSMLVQLGKRLIDEAHEGRFKAHWEIVFTVGLVILSFVYGLKKLGDCRGLDKHEVKVMLLQSNFSQNQKHGDEEQQLLNYAWFESEKQRAFDQLQIDAIEKSAETGEPQESEKPDVVILPESALTHGFCYEGAVENWYYFQSEYIVKHSLLADGDHSVIFGSNFYEAETTDGVMGPQLGIKFGGKDYNAIALAGPRKEVMLENGELTYDASSMNIYGKVHLVPFGEYFPDIPFRESVYSALYGSNPSMSFSKGTSFDSLPLAASHKVVGVIPAVCFEDSVGRVTRKFVKDEPQMIVNVTNDGWFGQSKAAMQHMINAKFRAIELRRPMVRCANTGVSCIIDITGGLVDEVTGEEQVLKDDDGSIFTAGHLYGYARVPSEAQWTLYTVAGDWFVILCVFLGVGMIVAGKFKH